MILTPTIPCPQASSFALLICFLIAIRLAFAWSFSNSGSSKPICAVEITPTPPSLATAPASLLRLTPTPIPPCIMGSFATISPILSSFNIICTSEFLYKLIHSIFLLHMPFCIWCCGNTKALIHRHFVLYLIFKLFDNQTYTHSNPLRYSCQGKIILFSILYGF